jgi:hypothetical protein
MAEAFWPSFLIRRVCGVAVAELDHVIFPIFQARFPIRRATAVFRALGFGGEGRKPFAVQIQMQNRFHIRTKLRLTANRL